TKNGHHAVFDEAGTTIADVSSSLEVTWRDASEGEVQRLHEIRCLGDEVDNVQRQSMLDAIRVWHLFDLGWNYTCLRQGPGLLYGFMEGGSAGSIQYESLFVMGHDKPLFEFDYKAFSRTAFHVGEGELIATSTLRDLRVMQWVGYKE